MSLYKLIQSYTIGDVVLQLCVPDATAPLQSVYSPYWGKVWPAAIGLCTFLQNNLHYIQHKKVSELAAGLGLPSLFAATYAAQVHCSDVEPAAMELVKKSALQNNLNNVFCTVANWNNTATVAVPQTLLISDVNYEPAVFEELLQCITFYLLQHCTVIISTPQRLMAKPFIMQLLPYCTLQQEVMVNESHGVTAVSVFVLQR